MSYKNASLIVFSLFIVILLAPFLREEKEEVRLRLGLPVTTIEHHVFCSKEFLNTFNIVLYPKLYLVKFPKFYSTPIIQRDTVCELFIKEWVSYLKESDIKVIPLDLQKVNTAEGIYRKVEFYKNFDTTISTHCEQMGFCKTNFWQKSKINDAIQKCQPKSSILDKLKNHVPKYRRPNYEVIKDLDIQLFPANSLVNELSNAFRTASKQAVFASTMTLGNSVLEDMIQTGKTFPTKSVILLDAGIHFHTQQANLLKKLAITKSNVLLLPITSGREFSSFYHKKFVLNEDTKTAYFTSSNLASPEKSDYLDFIYKFSSSDIFEELQNEVLRDIDSQCAALNDLECFLNFDQPIISDQKKLMTYYKRACSEIKTARGSQSTPQKYFMNPQDTDIEYLLERLIDQSRKEIVILSHRFSSETVVEALKRARARGVKVYVFTGERVIDYGSSEIKNYASLLQIQESRRILFPHMKLTLIDREMMFFGTANYSTGGMNYSSELFALSDNKAAIEIALSMAASYFQAAFPRKRNPLLLIKSLEEQYLMRKNQDMLKPTTFSESVSTSNPLFERFNSKARGELRQCAMQNLLVVLEEDYKNCAARLGHLH